MPFVRVGWNKYETALLVKAYKDVVAGDVSRKDAAAKLSERLRNRLIVHGIAINDKYRNINGISLQMGAIEYCFTNGEHGVKGANELFREIVQLSAEDQLAFDNLVFEAEQMYPELAKYQALEYVADEEVVSEEAPTDRKLLATVSNLLSQRFKKGYRLNSAIENMRFRRFFQEDCGQQFEGDDQKLSEVISACGIEIDHKVYVPQAMLAAPIKDKLADFITESFSEGKNFVFYDVIFNTFRNQLLDSMISTVKTLSSYLKYYFGEKWFFSNRYVALRSDVEIRVDDDVIEFVREQGRAVMEDEVVAALSWLPEEDVERAFDRNSSVLIASGRNQRFHRDLFVITDEQLESVSQFIRKGIEQYKFISADELMSDIKASIPDIVNNNSSIPELGIRRALYNLLEDDFSFNNAVISERGNNLSAKEALLSYAQKAGHFRVEEIDNLAKTLGTVINYHLASILPYSLRVNDYEFVPTKDVDFDVNATDAALDKIMAGSDFGFVPLKSIHNFSVFPSFDYPWNQRLLESFLITQDSRYGLIYGDYLNKNKICGAVVDKSKSEDLDFDSILALALLMGRVKLKPKDALEYIYSEGYISQRRYVNIGNVISMAPAITKRLNKENNK